jgi:flagellar biosynthesis protein FlhB
VPDRDEKTESPTAKRRHEAREQGNIPRSMEINSVAVLLAALVLLEIYCKSMYQETAGIFNSTFALIAHPQLDQAAIMHLFAISMKSTAKMILPIILGILAVGVVVNVLQVGWLFTLKPLEPKFSKINPLTGLARFFSMRSLVELAKSLAKIAIIGWVAYATIKGEFKYMVHLSDASVGMILLFILNCSMKIILRVLIILAILAILDFAYQRYDSERNLKMTKQEVKDEHKQMEGDPKVKSRIRRLQLEMARRRMMKEVPKATVVVTNPTFIAIAIRYEPDEMQTPLVVAKGKRLVAERIKQVAREAGVPIVEDKPLARTMYDRVAIGGEIPVEFFTAVAEILAYVYRLKNRMAA